MNPTTPPSRPHGSARAAYPRPWTGPSGPLVDARPGLAVAYLWIENLGLEGATRLRPGRSVRALGVHQRAIAHPVLPAYSSLVENLILPHFIPFGWGVLVAEGALGAFLLLGLATRFWALVGLVQSFVIYLTVGAQPHEWPWTYVLMMLAHLAIFAVAAGRVGGVDGWLRRRARVVDPAPRGWHRWLLLAT